MIWTDPYDRDFFYPITSLDRSDARLSLLFLDGSEIYHNGIVEDPWFLAKTPILALLYDDNDTETLYISHEPGGVLTCAKRALYCNPELPKGMICVMPPLSVTSIFTTRFGRIRATDWQWKGPWELC